MASFFSSSYPERIDYVPVSEGRSRSPGLRAFSGSGRYNLPGGRGETPWKRLIVALGSSLRSGMAGHALAMDKKINIFSSAQYDIYTLYLSPPMPTTGEENLLKQETLPNGDKGGR